MNLALRSTEEVFRQHLSCRLACDLEEDLARNYSQALVMLTNYGVFRGLDGLRRSAHIFHDKLPRAKLQFHERQVDGEIAFLTWTAQCDNGYTDDGVDSFVIRGGRILVQTIHYTVKPWAGTKFAECGESCPNLKGMP